MCLQAEIALKESALESLAPLQATVALLQRELEGKDAQVGACNWE